MATTGIARRARAADTIKVGFTTGLTGRFNEFGEGYKRGIQLAIERLSKTGGELIKAGITKLNAAAVVTHESYNQKDQDMTAQLVRMQRARSVALMVVGLGADMAVIRKNMTRMNMTLPLFVSACGFSPPDKHHALEVGDLATYEYAKVAGRLTLVQTTI